MRQYQVYAQKVGDDPENYTVDHSSRIYLMDRDAKLMALFSMDTEIPVMIEQVKKISLTCIISLVDSRRLSYWVFFI
jgi:cytochrome oxidase Cu insertion factor (SCO1/SenC/PrrC family)